MGFPEVITYRPIGVIRSPFSSPPGTPIQPAAAEGVEGTVEVFPEYEEGLRDLEGFSHVILIYHFHLAGEPRLLVRPFMDDRLRGVFATRAPSRPNPIGLSVVRLASVEGRFLRVLDIDVVDGTPLLDLKPYVPEFDVRRVDSVGWLEGKSGRLREVRDDGRFAGIQSASGRGRRAGLRSGPGGDRRGGRANLGAGPTRSGRRVLHGRFIGWPSTPAREVKGGRLARPTSCSTCWPPRPPPRSPSGCSPRWSGGGSRPGTPPFS